MAGLDSVRIPYGAYWSTPFARWQMSLSHLNSVQFAADTAKKVFAGKRLPIEAVDHAVLGMTVPQEKSFWGVPWLMAMAGAPAVSGPMVSQACATSARCLALSAAEIAGDNAQASLAVTCDRTSNSPVMLYPNPRAPGGAPTVENWVLDNFRQDPHARCAMVDTAENCARDWRISTAEQHDLVLRRYQQYQDALADDGAFQRRYMPLPLSVPDASFRKERATLTTDEGVFATTAEGLAKLKPLASGGTVTYGGQTHPADGNAGILVTSKERAAEFSTNPAISITLRGFGQARERPAYMPAAPVKAARRALGQADVAIDRIDAVKSHNPFVVNDIVFARETGFDPQRMNNYGCSLIFGHPQGPTGLRLIVELIEELAIRGGGIGLFHGCAAGDTAMAVVLEVRDSKRGN